MTVESVNMKQVSANQILKRGKKLADYFNVSVPYLQGFININIPNNFKFNSKKDAIDCIEKIMKALDISKEDLEKSINDEKQD